MVTDVDNNINEQKDIVMKKNTKQKKTDKNLNLNNLHLKKVKKNKKPVKLYDYIKKII